MKKVLLSFAISCAMFMAGCGGSKAPETAKEEAAAPAGAATATIDEATAATVTGKVNFSGTKPTEKTIDMSATPACARAHAGAPPKSEEVVVNGNGTLKNVFVWVKSGVPDKQWPVPSTPVDLAQKGCMYGPHVIGVMTNQDIKIVNDDPTNHNIHPLPKINQEWNQSQPPKGDSLTKKFPREEVMIPVKCNVHPWMRSYIGVVSHPFFAVTGDDGTFTIKGLPPGKYTVEAWHEKYGTQDIDVTVAAKESKPVDFTFKGA
ncbi:MAG TPA: carboxypeptidase regulatory-like domain-containing protein [Bryobacteraceae bacterium]|nr:carboxypeptidase regulatory-like domain-containing protein [Bryobacteraceae bacterium]